MTRIYSHVSVIIQNLILGILAQPAQIRIYCKSSNVSMQLPSRAVLGRTNESVAGCLADR